jgi:hypothetical protein
MVIELLVVPDCPNEHPARQALQKAAALAGLGAVPVTVTVIDSDGQAQRRKFVGSPTFLFDGTDPFAVPGAPTGLMCRVYSTPGGLAGAPTVEQLRDALMAAASARDAGV